MNLLEYRKGDILGIFPVHMKFILVYRTHFLHTGQMEFFLQESRQENACILHGHVWRLWLTLS